jgi:hypothetical protein
MSRFARSRRRSYHEAETTLLAPIARVGKNWSVRVVSSLSRSSGPQDAPRSAERR